ncbi:hypothetical protein [Spiroplasma mirum]|nr:hypothetical protein [Spiroplasma atrichopogonis]
MDESTLKQALEGRKYI